MRLLKAGALFVAALLFAVNVYGVEGREADAEARGMLRLAWDSFDSLNFNEALKYLDEVPPRTALLAEVVTLKAECLYQLERFSDAVTILEDDPTLNVEGRVYFLEDIYAAWAAKLVGGERYDEAKGILLDGARRMGKRSLFSAMSTVVANQAEINRLSGTDGVTRLKGGGELKVVTQPLPEVGDGWIKVCPPGEGHYAEGVGGCREWMPVAAYALEKRGGSAWLRITREDFRKAASIESAILELDYFDGSGFIRFSKGPIAIDAVLEDALLDSVTSGAGLRGGAKMLVYDASRQLDQYLEMLSWMKKHGDRVEVESFSDHVLLKNPATGRTLPLYFDVWGELFEGSPGEWEEFWRDVTTELAMEVRPFTCFCGRDVLLRQTIVNEWEGLVAEETDDGVAVAIQASCPLHWAMVRENTLTQWEISREQLLAEVERQALESVWEIGFRRVADGGSPYLILAGWGVSSLTYRPDVLLNVLEAVDGKQLRGESVKVWAPTMGSLIVAPQKASDSVASHGARIIYKDLGPVQEWGGPLRVNRILKLPGKPVGQVRLRSLEN